MSTFNNESQTRTGSKIAKFIASALNNSSANEAAQALKMAASAMQKEGVNPSDLLMSKDGDYCTLEELREANGRVQRALERIRELENQSKTNELREAKQVAIKWHKAFEEKEQELEQALEYGSRYQKGYIDMQSKRDTLRTAVKWLGGLLVVACAFSAVQISKVNDLTDQNHSLGFANSELQYQVKQSSKPAAPSVEADQVINSLASNDSATCKIQGKVYDKETKRYERTKFVYQDGIVTTFTDGKKQGTDKEVSREVFLNNVNRAFAGKADCKLGVIN
ncbi:hypothetical protein K3712_000529 [Escherichia coli]|nr:hypothetical protein [Escherichia coli]